MVYSVCGDLSLVVDGFRCKQRDGTIQEADLVEDRVVNGETFVIWETFLMEMVERILLLQLESEIDDEVPRAFAISDI